MKIYLVGGAIRNKLLSLPVKEKDWLVIESNIDEMIKLGFKQVGKNFPVFINPITKEEYALARTEKKNGYGYSGFICNFSSSVTIEEDLYRRDITINAIAEDKYGNIIDPYLGLYHIKKRIIKHISNNFSDDPLRVLRVARIFAYLYHLGFKIDKLTLELMKKIVNSRELIYISYERIWIETKKSLLNTNSHIYFYTLHMCGALKLLFNEFYKIIDKRYIKNKIIFFLKKIKKIKNLKLNILNKFLYIIYEISKNLNVNEIKYEISSLLKKLNISKYFKKIIIDVIKNYFLIKNIKKLNSLNIIKLIYNLKLNDKKKMNIIKEISYEEMNNIIFLNNRKIYIHEYISIILNEINSIYTKDIINKFKGKNIKLEIIKKQKEKIDDFFVKNKIT
ncbi:CCA-adding enzyme [endosymbiont of Sipalinus gigas]|uniref:CCA-adding protein n=1 Tax=endosymbiont of Sipalinus gigas TaxID=1972134 RepID=UPI000DC6DC9C|nr:CCA-adding protein [endosymbiont of Sipalinus gigas]BBA85346.1 CCA-adding enzyme [endosymbiont of Sipalinus gigas]